MSTFPGSPRLVKGGIVLLNPTTGAVEQVITLQYNPDLITRSLQVQGAGNEGDRLEALRLKGPAVETIKLEAELDAADQLEFPRDNPTTLESGIHVQLAALEMIVYPPSSQLKEANRLAGTGVLEILPATAPLTLFVWSKHRVIPVRITEFTVTEEAFDPSLNPLRAKVSLGMRVLTVNDLDFASKGGSLYLVYQQQKEQLAKKVASANLSSLGIGGIS
jgi:hypothetical protein